MYYANSRSKILPVEKLDTIDAAMSVSDFIDCRLYRSHKPTTRFQLIDYRRIKRISEGDELYDIALQDSEGNEFVATIGMLYDYDKRR